MITAFTNKVSEQPGAAHGLPLTERPQFCSAAKNFANRTMSSQPPPPGPSSRPSPGRLLVLALALTLAWHAVIFAGSDTYPALSPSWFPDAGATLVNVTALAVTLLAAARFGLVAAGALALRRPDHTWWLGAPLLAEGLVYAVPGLAGSATTLLSGAVLALSIGAAEEALSRGVVQGVLTPLGRRRAAAWVAVLFAGGHVLSGLWFDRAWGDTAFVVLSAGCYGYCLAALRWHVGTIWPLAALHALSDFTMLNSPQSLPFGLRVAILAALVGYGRLLLAMDPRPRPAALRESSLGPERRDLHDEPGPTWGERAASGARSPSRGADDEAAAPDAELT